MFWTFALILVTNLPIPSATVHMIVDDLNWAQFRGPNCSGVDAATALPTDLSPRHANWSVDLQGSGHSSPVIWNQRLWVTSFQSPSQVNLECFDAVGGQRLWTKALSLALHPMHRLNNPASSTPLVDADRVYLLSYEPGHLVLRAFSHEGEPVWQRDFGNWVAQHGFATSPIVCNGLVVFLNSQEEVPGSPAPEKSQIVAVNSATGETVWTCPMVDNKACYAIPVSWRGKNDKEWLIVGTQGDGIIAVDPATGKQRWSNPVFRQRTVGSPVIANDALYANNGSGGGGNYLVKMDLRDESHKVEYEIHQGVGYVPTVIAVGENLFGFGDGGVVCCWRQSDGRELWRERISSGFWASPVSDGRNLFCLDKDGTAHVIAATDKFQLLGSYKLDSPSQASAAICDGRIYFRTSNKLWCFGQPTPPSQDGGSQRK